MELVHRELGTNTIFENDVNLAALGERWRGLGRGVDEFVYLHIGTGVGLGIVVAVSCTEALLARRARSGTCRCGGPTCARPRAANAVRWTVRRAPVAWSRPRNVRGWAAP